MSPCKNRPSFLFYYIFSARIEPLLPHPALACIKNEGPCLQRSLIINRTASILLILIGEVAAFYIAHVAAYSISYDGVQVGITAQELR